MILNGPVVITTTRHIRKRSPFKCNKGDEASHLVGLQLTKLLFNYYSTERDIVISETVITQLIEDINDEANIQCETKEANIDDKYTESEVVDLLLHGSIEFNDMSEAAKTMLERLRYLLNLMLSHLKLKNQSSKELQLIHDELAKGVFPLVRPCKECKTQAYNYEENGFAVFCNLSCQVKYYNKKRETEQIG